MTPRRRLLPRSFYRARRWLRRHGPRLHRRRFCELHNARVWVSTRATRSKRGAVFCSPACKWERAHPTREQYKRRQEQLRPKCPRPDKRAYDTEAETASAFLTLLAEDPALHPYLCRCGRWHAGHAVRVGDTWRGLTPEVRKALLALQSDLSTQA